MAAPYFTPKVLNKTVTTAGTRVQITTGSPTPCRSVTFQANSANTGAIFIGDSSVSSTVYGVRLAAGSSYSIGNDLNDNKLDLSTFWVDSSVNAEGLSIFYF